MEKLILKHKSLIKALATLEIALHEYSQALKEAEVGILSDRRLDIFRDALIQRFEYCFELLWKHMALYMQTKEIIDIPVISPKTVFRTAGKAQLLSEEEVEVAIEIAEQRNKTSHIYREEIADFLAKHIPSFYEHMMVWSQRFAS